MSSFAPPGSKAGEVIALATPLASALHAFYSEHEYCGELDSGVEEHVVWLTCSCGATIVRPIDD
jgi:hypothetical protein